MDAATGLSLAVAEGRVLLGTARGRVDVFVAGSMDIAGGGAIAPGGAVSVASGGGIAAALSTSNGLLGVLRRPAAALKAAWHVDGLSRDLTRVYKDE